MDITALEYFKIIAESGSLTKAAQQLHITQPAMSTMLDVYKRQGLRRDDLIETGAKDRLKVLRDLLSIASGGKIGHQGGIGIPLAVFLTGVGHRIRFSRRERLAGRRAAVAGVAVLRFAGGPCAAGFQRGSHS